MCDGGDSNLALMSYFLLSRNVEESFNKILSPDTDLDQLEQYRTMGIPPSCVKKKVSQSEKLFF